MPKKYNIPTKTSPPRFTPIGKSTILDWEGGCLRCFKCVKRQCIYDVYNERTFDVRQMTDTIDSLCKNCLRCVQSCPGQVITKVVNAEYKRMGNSYWTPDIIRGQWFQAETGRIPVSGAGYGGPFSGPGFDDMWTDMSEIVRPTRDGIHGREYINTVVDLGRSLRYLRFDAAGHVVRDAPGKIEIPIPIILKDLPLGSLSESVFLAMAEAAQAMDTFMIVPVKEWKPYLEPYKTHLIPLLTEAEIDTHGELIRGVRIIEIQLSDVTEARFSRIRDAYPDVLIMVRMRLGERSGEDALALTRTGADILHLCADRDGNVESGNGTRFVKDVVRSVHMRLVEAGCRNEITLFASGGIAMAEHVAKGIIVGADAVAVDIPLLLALECRLCFRCEAGLSCPVEVENIHPDWGKNRILNLIAAWRNQLIEVLGAMGIREIRRLRGEVGRAMFFDDLEKETFGKLFGKRTKRESVGN